MDFSARCKKAMSRVSARRFKGFATSRHFFAEVDSGNFHAKTEFRSRPFHETSIRRRLAPAQSMIEMADDYITETRLFQHVHQSHRIQPARNSDQPPLTALGGGRPRNLSFDVQCSAFDVRCSNSIRSPLRGWVKESFQASSFIAGSPTSSVCLSPIFPPGR